MVRTRNLNRLTIVGSCRVYSLPVVTVLIGTFVNNGNPSSIIKFSDVIVAFIIASINQKRVNLTQNDVDLELSLLKPRDASLASAAS